MSRDKGFECTILADMGSHQELNRYQRRRNWQCGQEMLGDVISQTKTS